ncbi:Forkhead box protein J3 [Termitomyces sp. J132]|nr:Forkhead box protein J3 [Termitomyces sp. J132]
MASLCNILNPDDGRRRTVRLIVNSMDEASTSEVPSSPGTSLVSDASDNLTVEGSSYKEHEAHPNFILRCAILGSPHQRLTIREIYAAMENKYAYYRTAGPTWKQSVRHHLSLNRLFERQPRPVTNPGFGSYWTVNLSAPPGTKRPRKRGRQNKEGRNGSPLPPKKRGRPRKSALDNEQFYSLLDLGDKQEIENSQDNAYISEEECESEEEFINPMDRRNSLAALGLSAYQPSRAPQTLSLPPFSTLQSSDNIMDSLQAEISALRRQSTDAISLSLRLSDQVLQAQAEASRTHDTLRTVQQRLDEETRRRSELQRMLNNEEKKRGKAEEALKAFLASAILMICVYLHESTANHMH